MEQQQNFFNILLFIAVIFGTYYIYTVVNRNVNYIEGMENAETNSATPNVDGIAGNGAAYLQTLKQQTDTIRERLNLTNPDYRKNTEDIILQMDEYINYLELHTILSINVNHRASALASLQPLFMLNSSRAALNNALKFLDKQ